VPSYLNPTVIGDFSSAGVSSGVATDVFVYAAGLAIDAETGSRRANAETIGDETRICLENVATILAEAGLSLRDVVKTTCYLRDESYRPDFIESYREVFVPGPYPARCTLILGLASNLRVQIEAIAVHPDAA
jgi:2-iminobutanoate/2-iminopropanoate deaminase